MLHVLEKMLKPKKKWTRTSIGIWVCFKSHWIKKSVDQNENKALGISEVSKKIALGSLWNQHPLLFLMSPWSDIPITQTGTFSLTFWAPLVDLSNTQERDMEQSLVILGCFLFRCPVSFVNVSLLFWCWFAAMLPFHEKKITSSKQLASRGDFLGNPL